MGRPLRKIIVEIMYVFLGHPLRKRKKGLVVLRLPGPWIKCYLWAVTDNGRVHVQAQSLDFFKSLGLLNEGKLLMKPHQKLYTQNPILSNRQ